jgi:hypothetical protein
MKSVKHKAKEKASLWKRLAQAKLIKEQYEGLARFVDTIAASAFIGAFVETARAHSELKTYQIVFLFGSCLTMLIGSLYLRRLK